MKKLITSSLTRALFYLGFAAFASTASAETILFSESFESTTAPDAGGSQVGGSGMSFTNWVTANNGFGTAYNAIFVGTEDVDLTSHNSTNLGQVTNADGSQFYQPGTYSGDSGLTTKSGAIATITQVDYTFSFSVAALSNATSANYEFQIWALNGLADSGRRDSRASESTLDASGTLLETVSGSITSNDFTAVANQITYTLLGSTLADYVGQDLAIRLDGIGTNDGGVYDTIEVTAVPEPGSFALIAGSLALTSIMLRRRRS